MTKVRGTNLVIEKAHRVIERKMTGLRNGLKKAAVFLLDKSYDLVPIDYGPLKASGHIEVRDPGTQETHVLVIYGGPNAPYAVYVHENPEALHGEAFNTAYAHLIARNPPTGPYRHSRRPNEAFKFLEKPFRDYYTVMINMITEEVRV